MNDEDPEEFTPPPGDVSDGDWQAMCTRAYEAEAKVKAALEVAGRAWGYGAPALYEDDVTDLFAALGDPVGGDE